MRRVQALFIAAFLASLLAVPTPARAEQWFPRPPALEPRVAFWTRVYTEVGTDAGLIHDSENLDVVYEVASIPPGLSRRARDHRIRSIKQRYQDILNLLGTGRRSNLSDEERRVLALWPDDVSNRTLRLAAHRVRFQRGQADKFRDGLIRSGRWRDHIHEVLGERGLPTGLAAIPHVESSFNPRAYSKVGAAGLWQFTRSTGRRFLRIDSVSDERMDPHTATVAAAALLRENYERTQSWPLAITAYNHGAAGMMRAVRKLGTRDIDVVIERYQSRTFGFASRNFYCEFLAALDIDSNPEAFFGALQYEEPLSVDTVIVDAYYPGASLARTFGVEVGLLQELNPSLRPAVWTGKKRVPEGFSLKLPKRSGPVPASQLLASIPKAERFSRQTRDRFHRISPGETLSIIARRYGVSQRTIMSLNNLRSPHRIRAGQRLRLPDDPADQVASRPGRAVVVEPAWQGDRYRVRRGENLTEIARRVGLTTAELTAANGIRNPNEIRVGQVLQIPGREAAAAATATRLAEAPEHELRQAVSPAVEVVIAQQTGQVTDSQRPEVAEVAEAPEGTEVVRQAEITSPEPAPEVPHTVVEAPAETSIASVTPAPPIEPRDPGAAELGEPLGSPDPVPSLMSVRTPASAVAEGLLLIDPSRWSVDGGDRTLVQPGETLGHYADWLELPTQRLRELNHLHARSSISIGQKIRLDFGRVSPAEFEQRRLSHHRAVRLAYLEDYEIKGTREHVLRRGETLWELSRNRYRVPVWLLRDYNPSLDFGSLPTGVRLTIPRVERRS